MLGELPRNTDEEAWQRSQAMNLYFDLPFAPNTKGGPIIQIHSATLKLFKLSQVDHFCYVCTFPFFSLLKIRVGTVIIQIF